MNILINRSVFQVNVPFTVYSDSSGGWFTSSNVLYTTSDISTSSITITVKEATTNFVITKDGDTKYITIVDELFAEYNGRESIINAPSTEMINSIDSCTVGVNSSGDYREFNAVIATVYDNMNYLLDYSKSLGGFPITYENRYGPVSTGPIVLNWTGYPDDALNAWYYDDTPNNRMMTNNNDNVIFVDKPDGGPNSIIIQGQNGIESQVPIFEHGYLGYDVGDVIGIHAEDEKIIVLDNTLNNLGDPVSVLLIYIKDGVTYNLATYWGDNPLLPESLDNAIDMAVYDNNIYILLPESIKIFNNIGYLLQTIDITSINNPISISVTINGILIADVDTEVLPATSNIVEINTSTLIFKSYNFTGVFENYTPDQFYEGAPIKRLSTGGTGTYFYVNTDTLVYKLTYDFKVIDKFGEVIADIAYNADKIAGNDKYSITYISASNNASLSISTNYDLHRVTDTILLLGMIQYDISDKLWSLDQCSISANEYATDWVYNRCFNRLYDNIRHIHRSIVGVPNIIFNLPINITTLGGFRLNQYSELPYSKHEIYVGMNEIHAEPSVNRAFRMIYKCMTHILDILSKSNFTIDSTIISLSNFSFDSFIDQSGIVTSSDPEYPQDTTESLTPWTTEIDVINDIKTVYFDKGRSVNTLKFSWDDTFSGDRSNPNFTRAFKYRYSPYTYITNTSVYAYIDNNGPYTSNGSGSGGEWGIRIAYNIISLTDKVKITWNKRIYVGVMDQGTTVDNNTIISNSTSSIIKNDGTINFSIPIIAATDRKYFIAVPASITSLELQHDSDDGLGGAMYSFTSDNAIIINSFINEYSEDLGDYAVYIGNINGGVFTTNEINFRLFIDN